MKQLLDELYQIEPNLREKETELEKVVAYMTTAKPDISPPDNFKKILKNRLESIINTSKPDGAIRTRNTYFRIFLYIFGGGIALVSFALNFGFL